MINKQKIWFLTLFSLILVLSVYYITMPSELLTTTKNITENNDKTKTTEVKKTTTSIKNQNTKTSKVKQSDVLTMLEVEKDEKRSEEASKYNNILTNKKSTDEEKNNAYEGLKKIDEIKSLEEKIKEKIKNDLKLNACVKIEANNVIVTLTEKKHDYTLANKIMRIVNDSSKDKYYVSVKFQK